MAAQCNLFAAQTLFELVNRSVIGRIDALQVVSRAAARDGPLHDAPLTGLANTLLAQVAIGAGENHVHASADTESNETGSELAVFSATNSTASASPLFLEFFKRVWTKSEVARSSKPFGR